MVRVQGHKRKSDLKLGRAFANGCGVQTNEARQTECFLKKSLVGLVQLRVHLRLNGLKPNRPNSFLKKLSLGLFCRRLGFICGALFWKRCARARASSRLFSFASCAGVLRERQSALAVPRESPQPNSEGKPSA